MMQPIMKHELLTCGDVALIARLTPAAIRAAERDGRIKVSLKTATGIRLFSRGEAERFAQLRAAKINHTAA